MKITQPLKDEHQGILLMIDILEKMAQVLAAGGRVDHNHLEQISGFIKIFIDRCHHKKEESILFPMMEMVEIPNGQLLINALLKEHFELHNLAGGLNDGIRKYESGDEKSVVKIVDSAKNYVTGLRSHIDKEDNVVYPLADQYIPQEKQEESLKQFNFIELNQIGPGQHERFHQMLDELKKIYLS